MRTERFAPRASLLIESMRDIGYTLETALADVIDNSITAGAKTVRLLVDTSTNSPSFAIVDDGTGMDEETLLGAMRLGSRSPLEVREVLDLGRFGLGLKTASFSQCRRLTIVSRLDGKTSCAKWDLDHVVQTDDWLIQIPSDISSVPCVAELGPTGTLVLWESLDRLVDAGDLGQQHFVKRVTEAAEHLELVFHRFLTGEKGIKKIKLLLNGRALEPFDPFHSDHPATDAGSVEKIRANGQEVSLQAFTLPHHQKVSLAEWERYGGRSGYVKNQGFYLYRGKRLIIHGTWFGLAKQMELTKLARVRIDIPNGLDAEWKIDVKKASAHPPRQVRDKLRILIETIGASSKRVYTSRGKRLVSDDHLPVWCRQQSKNEISYRINPDHPVIVSFMSRLADDTREDFLKIIELAGSTIPMDALFADISGQPGSVSGELMSPEALKHAVTATFEHLRNEFGRESIIAMLKSADPFRSQWVLTERIVAGIEEKRNV